jgi:hypothetical protein
MTYMLSTLVFDVFDMMPTSRKPRKPLFTWEKLWKGIQNYGTHRAAAAVRNGHIY